MFRSFTFVICEYEVNNKEYDRHYFCQWNISILFEMKDVFNTTQVGDIRYVQ